MNLWNGQPSPADVRDESVLLCTLGATPMRAISLAAPRFILQQANDAEYLRSLGLSVPQF